MLTDTAQAPKKAITKLLFHVLSFHRWNEEATRCKMGINLKFKSICKFQQMKYGRKFTGSKHLPSLCKSLQSPASHPKCANQITCSQAPPLSNMPFTPPKENLWMVMCQSASAQFIHWSLTIDGKLMQGWSNWQKLVRRGPHSSSHPARYEVVLCLTCLCTMQWTRPLWGDSWSSIIDST